VPRSAEVTPDRVAGMAGHRGRPLLAECLVRTLVVVDVPELVEPALLSFLGLLRRPCRLGLERAVHPLVRAVLFRVARHNALDADLARPGVEALLRLLIAVTGATAVQTLRVEGRTGFSAGSSDGRAGVLGVEDEGLDGICGICGISEVHS
jgi:hypothetical protein